MARLRKTINLDWKFHLGENTETWFKGFDDKQWKDVTLPHDWSVTEPFSKEHSSGSGYLSGGVGWYRTHFTLPEELKGKKVWVVFDGVYNNSMVWVNSFYLGKRPYGYSTFAYDITHAASFGDDATQISVRVNHEHTADSRWFTGSGITRKVSVIVKEPLYIDLNGVFFSSPEVGAGSALVRVQVSVVNETGEDAAVVMRCTLLDDKGNAVVSMEKDCRITAGQNAKAELSGTVRNPLLWSPESPNLYTLKTEVLSQGQPVDIEENRVGIRAFRFDADKGFFINGSNMKIKGVCVHHDAGCLGAAVMKMVWERRLRTLKEMGCNAIRMSHNPHMPELYDLCDSMGFLVIDEAFDEWEGPKNKWSVGHNVYPPQVYGYYEDFPEWHEQDLSAMVLRDRNHTSIILWSIGNEIDYPNDPYCHPMFEIMSGNNDSNKPAQERIYNPARPNMERISMIAAHLARIVKEKDDTRPITAAVAFPELSTRIGFIDALDVVGYNYKEQCYEQDHKRFPNKPFLGSENSHQMKAWRAVMDTEYISGQFLWTGIDYLGEARGWPIHGSQSGHLTLAGFKKPDYYFRKSLWTNQPIVQLVTARKLPENTPPWGRHTSDALSWNYNQGEEINVLCYTNCLSVDLRLNGESLGVYKLADFAEDGYITCLVSYREGKLEAVGTTKDGTHVTSILETAQKPACLIIMPDCTELNADGEDIAQLEVSVLDSAGRLVLDASDIIAVKVDGSGILLGIENGDLADNTDYISTSRHAYQGRLLVYVRAARKLGPIHVMCSTVDSQLIATAELIAK
jgi:beta-galactosidase